MKCRCDKECGSYDIFKPMVGEMEHKGANWKCPVCLDPSIKTVFVKDLLGNVTKARIVKGYFNVIQPGVTKVVSPVRVYRWAKC